MSLSDAEQSELVRLEIAFEMAGGRGVDLADRIDALRAKAAGDPNPWPETDDEKGWYDDWRNEVYDGNTTRGFRDWMEAEKAANEEDEED